MAQGELKEENAGIAGGGSGEPAVQVRSDFRTTVFWQPDVHTGRDGKAEIEVTFPDSLTEWRATARAVTKKNKVGWDKSRAHTQMPLIARLQAPRFFVVGDEVTLSAVMNNNTDEPMVVAPELDISGLTLMGRIVSGRTSMDNMKQSVTVPARGEARVDWRRPGQPGGKCTHQNGRDREEAYRCDGKNVYRARARY